MLTPRIRIAPHVRSPLAGLLAAVAFIVAAGCSSSPLESPAAPEVATLTVTLSASSAERGDTVIAALAAFDAEGQSIPLPAPGLGSPVWASANQFVATIVPGSAVGAQARVAIRGHGVSWLSVRLGGVVGSSEVMGMWPFPVITSASPETVVAGRETILTVFGSGFTDGSVLLVDGVPYSYQRTDWDGPPSLTPSWVAGNVPASALIEGTREIRVSNPFGRISAPYLLPVLPPS